MMPRGAGSGKATRDAASDAVSVSPSVLPHNGRLLGVDWGVKRIGLAISDPEQRVAHPVATLTRRTGRRFPLGRLKPYLDRYQPVGVVVGLPLEAEGTEGAAAQAARASAILIAEKTGLAVVMWDERMTSARVERERRRHGARAIPTDPLAATVLLQGFLDRRRG